MVLSAPRILRWISAGIGLAALAAALAIDLDLLAPTRVLHAAAADFRGPLRAIAWVSLALTLYLTAVIARPRPCRRSSRAGRRAFDRRAAALQPRPEPIAAEVVVEPETFSPAAKRLALVVGAVVGVSALISMQTVLSLGVNFFHFAPLLAAVNVALAIGGVALFVAARGSLRGIPSRRLRMPAPWTLALAFALVVATGEVLRRAPGGVDVVFVPWLLLGAALPPAAAVAIAVTEVRVTPSARRMMMAAVAGGTLSVGAAVILNGALPLIAAFFVAPIAEMLRAVIAVIDEGRFSDLLRSPGALLVLTSLAVVAPIVEEAVKPLGVIILGRRIQHARDALLLGLACGAGFGIIENILYEGGFFKHWAGVTAMRGLSGALHPVGAGLVSLGWYGVFQGHRDAWRHLGRNYVFAVGLHALWNGATGIFFLLESAQADVLGPVNLAGAFIDAGLVFFLLLEGIVMFWIVRHVSRGLKDNDSEPRPEPAPARVLALWGIACMAVLLPVAVAAGRSILQYLGTAALR